MGRGDKRTAKGKRFKGSFGNSRLQRKKKVAGAAATVAPKKVKAEKAVKEPKPKAAKKVAAEGVEKPKKAPAKKKKAEE
jgi:ribosomal small subunit protein bTHX